jgi:putative serine protease PepD
MRAPAERRAPTPQAFTCLGVLTLAAVVLSGCTSSSPDRAAGSATTIACDATTVATEDLPSVVTITATNGSTGSTGSGEVIRDDGTILTNNHVVSPAAQSGTISVLTSDGKTYPATLTGRDPQTDVAVIKVTAPTPLHAIPLGSSSSVTIGEPVVALGAPLGLSNTVTTGIVSALDRTVHIPSDNGQIATLLAALQTDAAINPGNSGGALTNCAGALIGVPTANATVTTASGQTSTGNVGISFAIPVDLAKGVADQLIASGSVTHSYLGLEVSALPPAPGSSTPPGLYVSAVAPGGPAALAGMLAGDVITEIEGEPAHDPTQLALLTLTKKPGETVKVTYERSGTSAGTTLTLGTPP